MDVWKGKQSPQTPRAFILQHLFILGICFCSFFGRNKLIFHSNVYLAVLFCLGVLGLFPSWKAGSLSSG